MSANNNDNNRDSDINSLHSEAQADYLQSLLLSARSYTSPFDVQPTTAPGEAASGNSYTSSALGSYIRVPPAPNSRISPTAPISHFEWTARNPPVPLPHPAYNLNTTQSPTLAPPQPHSNILPLPPSTVTYHRRAQSFSGRRAMDTTTLSGSPNPTAGAGDPSVEVRKKKAQLIMEVEMQLGMKSGGTEVKDKSRLTAERLKDNEETILRQLVLDYLSQACFTNTARILSSHPTSSSSNPLSASTQPAEPIASSSNSAHYAHDGDVDMAASTMDLPSLLNPESTTDMPDASGSGFSEHTILGLHGGEGEDGSGDEDGMNDGDVDMDGDGDEADLGGGKGKKVMNGKERDEKEEARELWIKQIEWRKEIGDSILFGDIARGMDLLQNYFPEVIDPESDKGRRISPSAAGHANGNGKTTNGNGNGFSTKNDATTAYVAYPVDSPDAAIPPFPYCQVYDRPTFLLLNMEIQHFVESIRALGNLSSPEMDFSSMASSMYSEFDAPHAASTANGLTGKAVAIALGVDGDSMNGMDSPRQGGGGRLTPRGNGESKPKTPSQLCLEQAQAVYTKASELLADEPDAMSHFDKAIEDAGGLLVYVEADESPLSGWLHLSRREVLAEMVNSSILVHTGQSPRPKIESIAKQTTVIFDHMKQHGVDPIPDWTVAKDGHAMHAVASYVAQKRAFVLKDFLTER